MKNKLTIYLAAIIFVIVTLLVIIYTAIMMMTEAHADTFGCTVICEVPEEPVRYRIPKIKGRGYFELQDGQVIYQTIER